MAVWSVARQDPLWDQVSWTRCHRFTATIGRAPTHLALRSQVSGNNQGACCCTKIPSPRGCLAGHDSSSEGGCQELLCLNSQVLLLNGFLKPGLGDGELAAPARDVEMGHHASKFKWSLAEDPDPRRPAGYERSVTAESVSRLCRECYVAEAVEALGVLVQTECFINKALFYTVLKGCVLKKDLVLGRRVHEDLVLGRRVHALMVKRGYQSDTFLCNHILRMYTSHGRLQDAMDVFTMVAEPNAFMWSSIISAHVKDGKDEQAIELYREMRRSSVEPDGHVFVAALQACARGLDLETGKQVHADVLAVGVEPHLFVWNSLVDMYAKCGSLENAQRVFDGLGVKDVVTWTALIAGYSQQGMVQEAFSLYSTMEAEGIAVPNAVTFVSLLQACANVGSPALEKGKELHAQSRERGYQADVFVANSLVNMYAKCGSMDDAQRMFDGLFRKDVVTWTALIAGYSQHGRCQEALDLYGVMQEEGVAIPNSVTFVSLLHACAGVGPPALEKGKQLHTQIQEGGHETDMLVVNGLLNMYSKCGSLENCRGVFDALGTKDVVSWNTMISLYSQQGRGQEALHLYSAMQEDDSAVPDTVTFLSLLQACGNVGFPALEKGKQLDVQIRERGHQADVFIGSSLVSMYAKCGSLQDAQRVFNGLGDKNVVTWNAMIAGYSQQGMGQDALQVYSAMQEDGMAVPSVVTFVCLLQACASVGSPVLEKGKQIHLQIRQHGFEGNVVVGNSLVNMYAKCGSLEDAEDVFDGLCEKNVVSWNVMIAGYSQQNMGQEALRLYSTMEQDGSVAPDSVTFTCLLQACASMGSPAMEKGKELHEQIRVGGHDDDVFVASSLVHMYAKCGCLEDAQRVFDGLGQKNVVTWNAMIAGYSQQGLGQEALRVYSAMQEGGLAVSNSVTFMCLLQACANVAALDLGRQLHAEVQEQGLEADVFVGGSLINMYGKCGSMVEAQEVFDALSERDVVSWSALIAGYTYQGDSEVVFDLVQRMRDDGVPPAGITFLSVLTVCSHVGLVNKGRQYFDAMTREYGISPTVEHYTCMVDLLGRAGQLGEALALAKTMPVLPNAAVWHTLLGACRKWSNVEVGCHAFNEALKLDEKDAAAYVLMSGVYTGAQMWEQAEEMQSRRMIIGAWKQAGQSWWADMDGRVHSFLVGR